MVLIELTGAQAFDDFALLAGMTIGSLLLVAQVLQAQALAFQDFPLLAKRGFSYQGEM